MTLCDPELDSWEGVTPEISRALTSAERKAVPVERDLWTAWSSPHKYRYPITSETMTAADMPHVASVVKRMASMLPIDMGPWWINQECMLPSICPDKLTHDGSRAIPVEPLWGGPVPDKEFTLHFLHRSNTKGHRGISYFRDGTRYYAVGKSTQSGRASRVNVEADVVVGIPILRNVGGTNAGRYEGLVLSNKTRQQVNHQRLRRHVAIRTQAHRLRGATIKLKTRTRHAPRFLRISDVKIPVIGGSDRIPHRAISPYVTFDEPVTWQYEHIKNGTLIPSSTSSDSTLSIGCSPTGGPTLQLAALQTLPDLDYYLVYVPESFAVWVLRAAFAAHMQNGCYPNDIIKVIVLMLRQMQ
jgi:hypothetical protein